MIRPAVRWLVLVGIGVAIVTAAPDVARYLRIREMSR